MSSPSYRKVQPFEVDEESATGEVTVVAPSDMPGGFQFACEVEGKKYTVEVVSAAWKGNRFDCFVSHSCRYEPAQRRCSQWRELSRSSHHQARR